MGVSLLEFSYYDIGDNLLLDVVSNLLRKECQVLDPEQAKNLQYQ